MALTKNQIIFSTISPWDSEFQGTDKKVLFVCSAGILRSATAARLYSHVYNTRCAGSEDYALIPVTPDLLLWADQVVFINEENYLSIVRRFDLDTFQTDVVILNIDDKYDHMEAGLVELFNSQYEKVNPVIYNRIINKVNL
jgi:predicted protein tyrosine phosphatase